MIVKVLGNLDRRYLESALKKTRKLIKVPKSLNIYFLENINLCYSIKLPRNIQNRFKITCAHRISFSFKFKKREVIIIYVDKLLLNNQDSLVGLLLHEVSHINQINRGTYKGIQESYDKVREKNYNLLKKLDYDKKELIWLFHDISAISVLTLKDIYANNELIKKKLTNYLISYYKLEFDRKICPKPFFYGDIKTAAKDNLDLVKNVFEFELSLISVILPLYKTKKAHELINYFSKCYEVNIKDVSRKCHQLINLYFRDFRKENFNEEFFNAVFMKVYNTLN